MREKTERKRSVKPLKVIELAPKEYEVKEQSGIYELQQEVIQQWLPSSPSKILDVGCGQGHVIKALCSAQRNQKDLIIGIDYSWPSIRKAKQRLRNEKNVYVIYCNAYHMPFRDHFFDGVLSTGYQSFATLPGGINTISRVLKRGGILILDHLRPYNIYSFVDGTFCSLLREYQQKKILLRLVW